MRLFKTALALGLLVAGTVGQEDTAAAQAQEPQVQAEQVSDQKPQESNQQPQVSDQEPQTSNQDDAAAPADDAAAPADDAAAPADDAAAAADDATAAEKKAAADASKKCPAECWEFKNDKCEVLDSCFDLTCNFGNMHLSWDPKIFMIDDSASLDDEKNNPTNTADIKSIFTTPRFVLDCPLGECGMNLKSLKMAGEDGTEADHLLFSYTLKHHYPGEKFQGMDLYLTNPINIEVMFQCAYKEQIKVESDSFDVHAIDAKGKLLAFGELDKGFELLLFQDKEMKTSVASAEDLYIGAPVFAKVHWKVSTLKGMADFFIHGCSIGFNDKKINIIHNTCRSQTFDVQALTTPKNQETTSVFSFKSFIVGGGARTMSFKVDCNIKVCAVDEPKCAKMLIADDAECGGGAEYKYQA